MAEMPVRLGPQVRLGPPFGGITRIRFKGSPANLPDSQPRGSPAFICFRIGPARRKSMPGTLVPTVEELKRWSSFTFARGYESFASEHKGHEGTRADGVALVDVAWRAVLGKGACAENRPSGLDYFAAVSPFTLV